MPLPSLGEAPGVTFPPVAADASATTGLLQPGTWAVIADDKGPLAQLRLRDVRECGRLPDVRSAWVGGKLIVATADVRILRDEPGLAWLPGDMFYVGLGGYDAGQSLSGPTTAGLSGLLLGLPGNDSTSQLTVPVGFSQSRPVVADMPPGDLQVVVYPAFTDDAHTRVDPAKVRWLLHPGPESGLVTFAPWPSPGATETTGEVALGDYATIKDAGGDVALTVTDVEQVDGYPGLMPSPGHVFVESRIFLPATAYDPSTRVLGTWRALDDAGRELPIVTDADPTTTDRGIPVNIGSATLQNFPDSLLVVEAPPAGLIRLELTRDGEAQPLLSYVIRQP